MDSQLQNTLLKLEKLTTYLRHDNFSGVDAYLQSIDPKQEPAEVLVALLRMSYPVRAFCLEWQHFLDVVYHELKARHEDQKQILRGLKIELVREPELPPRSDAEHFSDFGRHNG